MSLFCEGIESFSKLGDSIYFEEDGEMPELYVIQYISSSLDWVSTRSSLIQVVDNVVSWDQILKVKLQVLSKEVHLIPYALQHFLSRITSLSNRLYLPGSELRDGYLELSDSFLDIFERSKSFSEWRSFAFTKSRSKLSIMSCLLVQ